MRPKEVGERLIDTREISDHILPFLSSYQKEIGQEKHWPSFLMGEGGTWNHIRLGNKEKEKRNHSQHNMKQPFIDALFPFIKDVF